MIGVALRGLLGRKLRATLTAFAIVLGVAMVSGSFVLTDTLASSFDRIFDESYESADAVISGKAATSADGEAPAFPESVLDDVRGLESAAAAAGSIEDEARLLDRTGDLIAGADSSIAIGMDGDASGELSPLVLVAGDWPSGMGEIAIDKATSEEHTFGVGDSISVVANGPVRDYRISAIVQFGSVDSIGGATIAVFDLATAQRLFAKENALDAVQVTAAPGVEPVQLVREIEPLLPETAQGSHGGRASCRRQQRHACRARNRAVLPPWIRCHRTFRGQLRDRQHALDHGGTACTESSRPCARSAHRVDRCSGRWCRGSRDRRPRLGRRSLSRARARAAPERATRLRRHRPSFSGPRVLDPDDRRQPARRNRDRSAREPEAAMRATRVAPISAVREGAVLPAYATRVLRCNRAPRDGCSRRHARIWGLRQRPRGRCAPPPRRSRYASAVHWRLAACLARRRSLAAVLGWPAERLGGVAGALAGRTRPGTQAAPHRLLRR